MKMKIIDQSSMVTFVAMLILNPQLAIGLTEYVESASLESFHSSHGAIDYTMLKDDDLRTGISLAPVSNSA